MEEGGLALLGAMAAVVIAYLTAAITTSRKLKGSTDYFDDMALEFLRSRFRQLPDDVPYETLGALAREIGCSPRGARQLVFLLGWVPDEAGGNWTRRSWFKRFRGKKKRALAASVSSLSGRDTFQLAASIEE
jgi:hypothetical protein